jgi:hypothetical protein
VQAFRSCRRPVPGGARMVEDGGAQASVLVILFRLAPAAPPGLEGRPASARKEAGGLVSGRGSEGFALPSLQAALAGRRLPRRGREG